MTAEGLKKIATRYSGLRIAVAGDFCLDRYLEIDPALEETSIETGLPVHNVVRVRSQPGAAGTILNNLVALGVGRIVPVGFCGEDGEGYELLRALRSLPGRGSRLFFSDARAADFYLLQAAGADAGRAAARTEPPGFQELDADAAGSRGPARAVAERTARECGRGDPDGPGRFGGHGCGDERLARSGRRPGEERRADSRYWPTAAGDCTVIRR